MEDVIRKIKKALALSHNNANAEESHTAMLLAQRLMAKHNLSMGDVRLSDQSDQKEAVKGYVRLSRVEWWQQSLAAIVATNFRCYPFYSTGKYIGFIGIESDTKIAVDIFKFAVDAIKYHSSLYLKSRKESRSRKEANMLKNDYIQGFLIGLNDKFEEQVERESYSIILVKDEIVEQAYKKMNLKKGRSTMRTSANDNDAATQGYMDGKNLEKSSSLIEGAV